MVNSCCRWNACWVNLWPEMRSTREFKQPLKQTRRCRGPSTFSSFSCSARFAQFEQRNRISSHRSVWTKKRSVPCACVIDEAMTKLCSQRAICNDRGSGGPGRGERLLGKKRTCNLVSETRVPSSFVPRDGVSQSLRNLCMHMHAWRESFKSTLKSYISSNLAQITFLALGLIIVDRSG